MIAAEQSEQETNEHRGLVIMSVLLNFVDWLNKENTLIRSEKQRGKLVLAFLASHSDGENYFLQADDIAQRLGVPFQEASQ